MADNDQRPRDKWVLMDADPVEGGVSAPRLFRGVFVAVPLGGLIWWGLVALWRAFA